MKTKDITQIALMVSIIILLGFFPPIPIGILPVPIALQSAGFMMSGLILGKKKGTIAALLFLGLVALGLPLLSGGRGGAAVFFNVTAGYLYAYPFATYFIGWSTEKWNPNNQKIWLAFAISFLFGALFIDFCGAIGVSIASNVSFGHSLLGNIVFLPGDAIKAIVAGILANRVTTALQLSKK